MSNHKVTILCIYGSPRKGGNTDRMMECFIEGVLSAGGEVEKIVLRELKIDACREIYACRINGECGIVDDMNALYPILRNADGLAMSSPVMFYGHGALAKTFMDRCQALWSLKYLVEKPVYKGRMKGLKGVMLAAGATNGPKVFDGLRMSFRYFMDALDGKLWKDVVCRAVDDAGEIEAHADILDEARRLGVEFVELLTAELGGEGGDGA